MSTEFSFATAGQIIFGNGRRQSAVDMARTLGSRALFVAGTERELTEEIRQSLGKAGLLGETFRINDEPAITDIQRGTDLAEDCDMVVAIGGGSAIDSGKAIAAMLTNGGDPLDYLEVVGKGLPLKKPAAPILALPTTAGTGAEVTKNAVLSVPEKKVKVSLRHPSMIPRIAVIDPELSYSVPPSLTASTGMDALTQCIEPYLSVQANPLTDAIALAGVEHAARSLRAAVSEPNNVAAREEMAIASLFGGIALANAKLGAVHGFAGVVGGLSGAPHGVVCATLLPHVFRMNVQALDERGRDAIMRNRYVTIARILTGNPAAMVDDAVKWLVELSNDIKIPKLSQYGVSTEDFGAIIDQSKASSSMKGNSIPLKDEELRSILSAATS